MLHERLHVRGKSLLQGENWLLRRERCLSLGESLLQGESLWRRENLSQGRGLLQGENWLSLISPRLQGESLSLLYVLHNLTSPSLGSLRILLYKLRCICLNSRRCISRSAY